MPTSIHQVRVSPTEGSGGFTATCTSCPWRVLRPTRAEADQNALDHQRRQVTPNPADQVNCLGELHEWVS